MILDRIGAGDAMVGGVLHGWLQGDFAKGLRYGALTAALALSQYGDQVITTSEELEALLEYQLDRHLPLTRTTMKIAVGSDHGGYPLKQVVVDELDQARAHRD